MHRSATSPQKAPSRAAFLIQTLNLAYLPKESGYIGLLGRSPHNVTPPPNNSVVPSQPDATVGATQRLLAAQSHNYYMLTSQYPVNYLHLLAPDDTHILIEGGPVEYYVFTPPAHPSLATPMPVAETVETTTPTAPHETQPASSPTSTTSPSPSTPKAERVILGMDYTANQTPILSVSGGCWKALRLCEGAEYALMANVLSPEFTEDRVIIGAGEKFVEMFKGRAEWASEEVLRELIGENWGNVG